MNPEVFICVRNEFLGEALLRLLSSHHPLRIPSILPLLAAAQGDLAVLLCHPGGSQSHFYCSSSVSRADNPSLGLQGK